ncbi:hypothetical protein IHE45_02G015100 [Dioscorea alata]|uniref:Uncharacterized protein n=1 Tax=Dioscorea alata TaxID=55571 RepID=A0ACB7WNH0_DIOAL|nr:hypothetical protein IHE45_02G015100 [Dioscorea alata]
MEIMIIGRQMAEQLISSLVGHLLDFIQQTLTLILHFLGSTVAFFTKYLSELLPIVLILFFLYCCCICCSWCFRVSGKMMKAPGRNGTFIPRRSFETNPRCYFKNLRGK